MVLLASGALLPAAQASTDAVAALGQEFAPGTILTPAAAERALERARAVAQSLQEEYAARAAYCDHTFFVNRCLLVARRHKRDGDAEVRRVTLEAHDLQRQLEAQAHAQARLDEARRQAEEERLRPERERQAQATAQARAQVARERAHDELVAQQRAEQDSAARAARLRQNQADRARDEAQRPHQEALARHDSDAKRQAAADYAAQRALDRAVNARRRTERQKARDEQAAADQAAAARAVARPAGPP